MSSLRQIQANRANSQKSTGPRSAEGKAASCMNALQSGIDAQSNIIRGENAADLQALAGLYCRECQPSTTQEQFYVDILIRNDWQLRRLERADAEMWEYQLQGYSRNLPGCELGRSYCGASSVFARFQRRKNDIQRSSALARQELRKLQAERSSDPPPQPTEADTAYPQIGFVSPISDPPPATPPEHPGLQPAARLTTNVCGGVADMTPVNAELWKVSIGKL